MWKTGIKDMSELGSGVVLYFAIMKYMAIVFTLLTVLAVPAMYLAVTGVRGKDTSINLLRLSIAEAGPPVSSTRSDSDMCVSVSWDLCKSSPPPSCGAPATIWVQPGR